jgi:hypothetical protein
MTVIPTREDSVVRAIRSVQEGTVKPDAMYINIPKKYARFKEPLDPNLIPKLKEMGVIVNELDEDRACLNKILPTLEFEKIPETLIVTMDDDMTYSPIYIAGLIAGWQRFGGVVGYSGLYYPETVLKNGKDPMIYGLIQEHGALAEILEDGFGTILPLRAVQGFPYVEPLTPDSDPTFYLSDDYIFCRFYDYKGIQKRVINFDQIGRKGDDWSSICKENQDAKTHEIASSRKSLQDFMNSGEIIKKRWSWFT